MVSDRAQAWCMTSPTVWNDPSPAPCPRPQRARSNGLVEVGHERPLGARRRAWRGHGASARSHSRFQPLPGGRRRHASGHPSITARRASTSISGQSLSPRMETRACTGPGGGAAASAATRLRIPSGLWATSKSHRPRRSSRPGMNARPTPRATAPASGRQGAGSAARAATATAALRRWCGPARPICARSRAPRRGAPRGVEHRRRRPARSTNAAARACRTATISGRVSPMTKGTPGFAIPAFSPAMSLERVAQVLHVVELDLGDGADQRRHHVGAVEPPAEAHLDHRDLDAARGEVGEGDGGGGLEEGAAQLLDQRPQPRRSTSPRPPREIGTPSTRMRSRNDTRCGEV